MNEVLFSWLGTTDVRESQRDQDAALSGIAKCFQPSKIVIMYHQQKERDELSKASRVAYERWLQQRVGVPIVLTKVSLQNPMHFADIYKGVKEVLVEHLSGEQRALINISSGTGAMTAVWVLIGTGGLFSVRFANSSAKHGPQITEVPFEVCSDFLPDLARGGDAIIGRASRAHWPERAHFNDIKHHSEVMSKVIERAQQVARSWQSVLIVGESGTGKELFARAIHRASGRPGTAFVARNCGAIPENLVESTLFGHEEGAFTGASRKQQGDFVAAHQGSLFLDEVGELPLLAQVKLLRTLQERTVTPVGASESKKVDVRIIAATHQDLPTMVSKRLFRQDLFYRLAVVVLKVPPLRERVDDIQLLARDILGELNKEVVPRLELATTRTLSAGAVNKLKGYSWPGNVRELKNVLTRAVVFSTSSVLSENDIEFASLERDAPLLDRRLGQGFQIDSLIDEVVEHYIERAVEEAGGVKTRANELLGWNRGRIERRAKGR